MLGIIFVLVLIISFILALRALPELEVPPEAKEAIKSTQPKLKISGIFLFLKERTTEGSSFLKERTTNGSSFFKDRVLHFPTRRVFSSSRLGAPPLQAKSSKPSSDKHIPSSPGSSGGEIDRLLVKE